MRFGKGKVWVWGFFSRRDFGMAWDFSAILAVGRRKIGGSGGLESGLRGIGLGLVRDLRWVGFLAGGFWGWQGAGVCVEEGGYG